MGRIHEDSSFLKMNCLLLGAPNSVQWVLAALLWHRNRKTGQCNPRIATLATELHFSERTVKYALRWLKETGIVTGRNRGQGYSEQSYRIAPQAQWPSLIPECKKLHSESERKCTLESAKSALSKVQKVHLDAAASINELENRTRKENKSECSALLERKRVVTTREAHAPKNGICKPEETPPDPELSRLVDGLAGAMLPAYPRPGRPKEAKAALHDLLCNVTGEERLELAERIQDNLESWNEYWRMTALSSRKRPFIPMFAEWVTSGDCESPPSEQQIDRAMGVGS